MKNGTICGKVGGKRFSELFQKYYGIRESLERSWSPLLPFSMLLPSLSRRMQKCQVHYFLNASPMSSASSGPSDAFGSRFLFRAKWKKSRLSWPRGIFLGFRWDQMSPVDFPDLYRVPNKGVCVFIARVQSFTHSLKKSEGTLLDSSIPLQHFQAPKGY